MTVHVTLSCLGIKPGDELTDEGPRDADCPHCGSGFIRPDWAPHGYSFEMCDECQKGDHCWAYGPDGERVHDEGTGVHSEDYGGTHCHCGAAHPMRDTPSPMNGHRRRR